MDVTISVPGKFHAPKLASQLNHRDLLRQYYSSHPKRFIPEDIPREKITSVWPAEVIGQIGYRAPWLETSLPIESWNRPFFRSKQRLFDWGVSKLLPDARDNSLLVGYSGSMLRTIQRAQNLGYTTVVERSSAHIREQQQILENVYERFYPEGTPPISDRFVEREVAEYHQTDYIVVPSSFVAETFEKHNIPPEKVVTIPLGVDPSRVPSPSSSTSEATRPQKIQNVVGERPYLLFIGQVGLRKGIPYLLEAWDEANLPSHDLVIIGSIEHTVEDIIEETGDDVHILGWVEEIDSWYQNAELFVFPSLEDGFARVVLESLNCGTPVIITDHTGAKDRVREGQDGLIIPAGDSNALASAMKKGINRSWNNQEISDRIEGDYTWDHYADNVVSSYKRMIEP